VDWILIIDFLVETGYLLLVFSVLFLFTISKGRQAIINLIMGLYIALLISIEFPYYETLLGSVENGQLIAAGKLVFFATLTTLATILFFRIMPEEFRESRLESFGKKILLSGAATVLIMIFSFQVLPVTEFLTPGTPLQWLFASETFYFWWLLLPLIIIYVL